MNDSYWRPVSINCIQPGHFPPVAIFLKREGNYVLYKGNDREFTIDDLRRLERNFTEFVYIRTGDMAEVNQYLDNHLTEMLTRDDLSAMAKGKILYQASANCIVEMFESPETSANLVRCNKLIKHLIKFISTQPHILESIQAIAGHNFYIFAHSVQVTALSLLMHDKLFKVDPDEMQDVGVGALIHDYGMIFITDKVLNKPDPLSDVEYHKVKQHTQKGYEFLKDSGMFSEVALTIVRHHHERYDGNGYPARLKGDEIPRSAQVSAICDMYSALTLEKVYRGAVSHTDALKTMATAAHAGAFNVELFEKFASLVNLTKGGKPPAGQ